MKILILSILSAIIVVTHQQIVMDGSPASNNIYVGETSSITLVGDDNSINGADCVQSVAIDSITPTHPSWISSSGWVITIDNPQLSDIGTYTVQLLVTETGSGSWTFPPHKREISITLSKPQPTVNYNIPDYANLRAGIDYEITFPQVLCIDPLGDTLTYTLLDNNDQNLPSYFNLDMTNNRIYGKVPGGNSGAFFLRLYCEDSQGQPAYQDFMLEFRANNIPVQHITDFTPYIVYVGEGKSFEWIIPSNIYLDPDGDAIRYTTGYFSNYTLIGGDIIFTPGVEGTSKLTVTNAQVHEDLTGFHFFYSDGISSESGPITIPAVFSARPVASVASISHSIFPNDTFSWEFDAASYYSDDNELCHEKTEVWTYTFPGLPGTFTASLVSGSTYKIEGTVPASTSDINFSLNADDSISVSTSIPVTIQIATCANECTKWYGANANQWYSCSGNNALEGSTCAATCPTGKYNNNGVCTTCHSSCTSCTAAGNTSCQSCDTGNNFFLKGTTCTDDCGDGFFGFSGECYACAANCMTCTGELNTEWQVCMENYLSVNQQCVPLECLANQYAHETKCYDWDESCKTCKSSGNDACNECNKGYMMQNNKCISCNRIEGYTVDQFGAWVSTLSTKCNCADGYECDTSNQCVEVTGPKCELSSIQSNIVTLSCKRKVLFKDSNPGNLFNFSVEGPRSVYEFSMDLQTPIDTSTEYRYLKFDFTPYSTYIGVNEETLKLTFKDRNKIVSATSPTLIVSNEDTSIKIYDSSDAVPQNVDFISRTLSYVFGFGTIGILVASFAIKYLLGAHFNLGWGLINFIQIIAFIPLASLYFPGNVRGYVSLLKLTNTAGSGAYNPYYLFVNTDNLDTSPYNYRFKVMDIPSKVFIVNCGMQVTIYIAILITIVCIKRIPRWVKDWLRSKKLLKKLSKAVFKFLSYNTVIKMIILLYMYLFLSALMTVINIDLKGKDKILSYFLGLTAFLFLILFIFVIFTIIQCKNRGLENAKVQKKYKSIIEDIDVKKTCARFYIPIYCLRRAVFMTIIVAFDNYFCLLAHWVAMLIICAVMRPYKNAIMNCTAIFNEAMITVLMAFSGAFLKKDMNNQTALNFGWVWIALASFTIFANWVIMIVMMIIECYHKQKMKQLQKEDIKVLPDQEKKLQNPPSGCKDNEDPHDFHERNTPAFSKNVNFVNKSTEEMPDSQHTMMSPCKNKNMEIENHYEDKPYEEEKSFAKNVHKKSRKFTDYDEYDREVHFGGISPTQKTAASPNKVLSGNVSDEINSVDSNDFNLSAIQIGEVSYQPVNDTKSHSRKISSDSDDYGRMDSRKSNLSSGGKQSSKNILYVEDMP